MAAWPRIRQPFQRRSRMAMVLLGSRRSCGVTCRGARCTRPPSGYGVEHHWRGYRLLSARLPAWCSLVPALAALACGVRTERETADGSVFFVGQPGSVTGEAATGWLKRVRLVPRISPTRVFRTMGMHVPRWLFLRLVQGRWLQRQPVPGAVSTGVQRGGALPVSWSDLRRW